MDFKSLTGDLLYGSRIGPLSALGLAGSDPARSVQQLAAGHIDLSNTGRYAADQALAYYGNMLQPPGMADMQGMRQRISKLDPRMLLAELADNEAGLSSLGFDVDQLRNYIGQNERLIGRMPSVDESMNVDPSFAWNDDRKVNILRQDIGRSGIDSLVLREQDPWLQRLNNQSAQVLSRRNPAGIAILGATAAAPNAMGGEYVPGAFQLPTDAVKRLTEARDLGPMQVQQAVRDLLSESEEGLVRGMAGGIETNDLRQILDTLRQDPSPDAQRLYRTLQQLQYTTDPRTGRRLPVGVGGRQSVTWPNVGTTSPLLVGDEALPQMAERLLRGAGVADVSGRQSLFNARGPGFTPAVLPPTPESAVAQAIARLETGQSNPLPELSDRQRFSASTYPGNQRTLSSDELADKAFSSDPETRSRANEQFGIRSAAADRRFARLPSTVSYDSLIGSLSDEALRFRRFFERTAASADRRDPNSDIRGNLERQAQALANRVQGAAISPPPRNTIDVPNPDLVDFRNPGSVAQFVDLKLKQLLGPGLDAVPDARRNTPEFKQLVEALNDPNTSLVQNGRFNPPRDAQGRSLIDLVLPEHVGRAPIQKNLISLIGSLDRLAGDTTVDDGRTIANRDLEYRERRAYEDRVDYPMSERRARMRAEPELRDRHSRVMADMGIIPLGEAPTTDSRVPYTGAVRARRRGNSIGNQGAFSGSESQYFDDPNVEGFGFGADPADRRESIMTQQDASRLQRGGSAPMTAPKGRLNRLKLGANILLFGNPEAAGFSRWSPEAVHSALSGKRAGPRSYSPGESLTVDRSFTFQELKKRGMSEEEIKRLPQRKTDAGVIKFIVKEKQETPRRLQGLSTRSVGSGTVDAMLGLDSENYTRKRLAPGKGGVRHRRADEKYQSRIGQIEQVNQAITNLGKTSEGRKTLAQLESAISQGDSDTVRAILGQAGALTEAKPTRKAVRQGSAVVKVVKRRGQPATEERMSVVSDGKKVQTPGAFIEEVARRDAGGDESLLPSARQDARRRFRFRRPPAGKTTGEAVAGRIIASRAERERLASRGQRPLPDRSRMTEFERGTPDTDTMRFEQRTRDQTAMASQEQITEMVKKARKRGKAQAKKQGVPDAAPLVFLQSELDQMPQKVLNRLRSQISRKKIEALVVDGDGKLSQFIKGGDVQKSGGDLVVKGKKGGNDFRPQDLKAFLDSKFKSRRKVRREDGSRKAMNVAAQISRMGINPDDAEKYIAKKYTHLGPGERLRLIRAIREHARRNSKPSMGKGIARGVAKLVTRGKA